MDIIVTLRQVIPSGIPLKNNKDEYYRHGWNWFCNGCDWSCNSSFVLWVHLSLTCRLFTLYACCFIPRIRHFFKRGGGLIWEIGIGSDWDLGCCFRADQQFLSCWCGYCATCRFHAYSGEEMVPAGTPQVDWPCCFRSAWCRRLQGEWGQECLLVHAGWYW